MVSMRQSTYDARVMAIAEVILIWQILFIFAAYFDGTIPMNSREPPFDASMDGVLLYHMDYGHLPE